MLYCYCCDCENSTSLSVDAANTSTNKWFLTWVLSQTLYNGHSEPCAFWSLCSLSELLSSDYSSTPWGTHSFKWKFHEGRESGLFCQFLYFRCLELFLVHSKCSINIYWMIKPWYKYHCFGEAFPVSPGMVTLFSIFRWYLIHSSINIYHFVFLWKTY